MTEKGDGIVAVIGIDRDPDTGRKPVLDAVNLDGPFDGRENLGADITCIVNAGTFLDKYSELVAPYSGDGVRVAERRGQVSGDLLEYSVTGEMAAMIIDVLEVVEINKEECEAVLLTSCPADGSFEAVEEQATIRQAGQRVGCCQADQLCFVADPASDVMIDAEGAAGLSIIVQEGHDDTFDPSDGAVTMQHLDLTGPLALLFNGLENLGRSIRLVLDVQDADRLTYGFIPRPPVELFRSDIPIGDDAVEVSDDHSVKDVFEGSGSLFESSEIQCADPPPRVSTISSVAG